MSKTSTIEWTDHTVNPGIFGCSIASPACENCYAAKMAHRQHEMGNYPSVTAKRGSRGVHWTGEVVVDPDRIATAFSKLPKKQPARVFITSMADLFHERVPFAFIDRVFSEMAARSWLTFQALTKRAARMAEYAIDRIARGLPWPPNVWAGTTVEDQRRADERIPHLLRVPAAVRFLSCEPLLGPLDLRMTQGPDGCTCFVPAMEGAGQHAPNCAIFNFPSGIHWVIAGGESGPKARASDPSWYRSLRNQTTAAGVAFFMKQVTEAGRRVAIPDDLMVREFPR